MNLQSELDVAYALYDAAVGCKLCALQLGLVQDVVYWEQQQAHQRNIIHALIRAQRQSSPTAENEVQS